MRRSGQTSAERYDFWTRASLYALLAAVPLLVLGVAGGQQQVRQPGPAVFLLLSAAQAGVWVVMVSAGALAVALAPRLSLPVLFGLVLVSAAAAGGSGPAFVGGVICLIGIGTVALTGRASIWTLRIMAELDRSRAAYARLSIAE